jgi:hypothetical protein
MKILTTTILTIVTISSIYAIPGTQKANFGGGARTASASFVIGNIGYMGTGFDGSNYRNDLWAYNPSTNSWTQKADIPNGRTNAIGFEINGKGYMGLGNNLNSQLYDFYEYNPTNNTWILKTPLLNANPTLNRGTGFSINNRGYFLSGNYGLPPNNKMLFWEFNPSGAGSWTQKTDLGGGNIVRRGPSGFSIGNRGYIGLGLNEAGVARSEFWEYNPAGAGTWTLKAPVPISGWGAIGFASSTKGYIGVGVDGINNKIYEYDPTMNLWFQKPDFTGLARYEGTGFSINGKGYLGTGSGSISPLLDFWEYDPSVVLPIELKSFDASLYVNKRQVNIRWETASEYDNAYFSIEKKSGDSDFQEIGQVKSRGNSSNLNVYDLIDKNPLKGISYYRLKQVNSDNTMTYSKIVSVMYEKGSKIKVYPTYTEGPVSIESNNELLDNVSVFTMTGQLMLQSKENSINLSTLTPGVYIVQVTTSDRAQFISKIFKK